MVAASFPNLSFENPPGTGPTLVSTLAEPYSIPAGGILTVIFAGATESVVFLESDFEDITVATAQEVADLLTARVDDLVALDDAGFVRLTSGLTGEDVQLQVQSGGVNTVLGFSTSAVSGETYAGGAPNGWSVTTDTYLVNEHAEFSDENGRPEEIFDNDGWVVVTVTGDFAAGVFDSALIATPFETFTGWAPTGVLLSVPTEQGQFDTLSENFEDFEEAWGSPTYFAFLPVHLGAGIDPEAFESGWNHDVGVPSYVAALFDDGGEAFEDFGDFIPYTWIVEVVSVSGTAADWVVTINGIQYIVNTGGANAAAAAVDLAAAINGQQGLSAFAGINDDVLITPANYDDVIVLTVAPASGYTNTVLARDYPNAVSNWTGNDYNPDFD